MQKYIDNNENTENELNNFVIESGNPQPAISGKTTFTQTHTHAQTCTHARTLITFFQMQLSTL